ncbi:MAG: putative nucleic acid-binding protein contains domain [Bryobacterales bacterium]|nr:putative nucleic acid-binding protein contains domain [Bryobacterales bacterium]
MILLDVNILLYAYDETSSHHRPVLRWLQELLSGPEEVGIPWLTLWAFVRIATNLRISDTPLEPRAAVRTLQDLLAWPRVRIIEPGPQHIHILEELVVEGQASGPRVTDAALAALAIEFGAALASTDRDFSRFTNLRWINPLAPA